MNSATPYIITSSKVGTFLVSVGSREDADAECIWIVCGAWWQNRRLQNAQLRIVIFVFVKPYAYRGAVQQIVRTNAHVYYSMQLDWNRLKELKGAPKSSVLCTSEARQGRDTFDANNYTSHSMHRTYVRKLYASLITSFSHWLRLTRDREHFLCKL